MTITATEAQNMTNKRLAEITGERFPAFREKRREISRLSDANASFLRHGYQTFAGLGEQARIKAQELADELNALA